jgi:hypothetical protein
MTRRWTGTATAVTSIRHTGETLGSVKYLRRERFLLPSGAVESIPVVSGNAVRGLLRDTAAGLFWDAIGRPPLPLAVSHALWSGGSLAKATGDPLSGQRLTQLRQACPVVGVFGAAGGGRVIAGTLIVSKLVPVCAQTAHLMDEVTLASGPVPDLWDITQVEYSTQNPDMPVEVPDVSGSQQGRSPARYGHETLIAGTRFSFSASLTAASDVEAAFWSETLAVWAAQGAHVGGGLAHGHGNLRLDLTGPPAPDATDWRAALPPSDEIVERLLWLN